MFNTGLVEGATDGSYSWQDGTDLSYTSWATDNPDETDPYNCVKLSSDDEYNWDDTGCDTELYFICEYGEEIS